VSAVRQMHNILNKRHHCYKSSLRAHGHDGRVTVAFSLLFILACLSFQTQAAEKKDEKKVEPKICCAAPFTLTPGVTKSLKVRGLALADASAIKLSDAAGAPVAATLKSKGKSEPPKPYEAPRAGDTEVQIDLKLPPDAKPGDLSLVISTPAGITAPFKLTVAEPQMILPEKEANNGFKTAQELPLGKSVVGTIQETSDVDVFRIGGRAGMKIIAEVIADRRGSLLDGSLTLYDAAGHILASADDSQNSRDPVLRFTLPADGVYYIGLTDANDHGSAAHCYVLSVKEEK
jgi:hypothetical protein